MTGLLALGLVRGRVGGVARGTGLVAAAALAVAGYQVGHSGGKLVYEHGAASVYTAQGQAGAAPVREANREEERDENR